MSNRLRPTKVPRFRWSPKVDGSTMFLSARPPRHRLSLGDRTLSLTLSHGNRPTPRCCTTVCGVSPRATSLKGGEETAARKAGIRNRDTATAKSFSRCVCHISCLDGRIFPAAVAQAVAKTAASWLYGASI